jgi:hypothetical protein
MNLVSENMGQWDRPELVACACLSDTRFSRERSERGPAVACAQESPRTRLVLEILAEALSILRQPFGTPRRRGDWHCVFGPHHSV